MSLRILHFFMIYPYLQYCSLVWTSVYPSNLSRLVILQKQIIKVISKSDFTAHTSQIFKDFHLLKFQDIKKLQTSQFMFFIRNNSLPMGSQDMFTLNNPIHSYNTRSSKLFRSARKRNRLRLFFYKIPRFNNI